MVRPNTRGSFKAQVSNSSMQQVKITYLSCQKRTEKGYKYCFSIGKERLGTVSERLTWFLID